jgi:hypothetical protein
LPARLHKGYFISNAGIGENTVFLKKTYKQYEALKTVPATDELYKMVADKDPLITLYDFGNRSAYKYPAMAMNDLIDKNMLEKTCKTIKGTAPAVK